MQWFTKKNGCQIAYYKTAAANAALPGVIFLNGFRSDMTSTKAVYLESISQKYGHAYIRFDYFGHGASHGRFEEGTLGQWLEDTLVVLDELTTGPQILVGSSMGGWIMLLVALRRSTRIQALIGIAAAPDFVEDFERLTPEQYAGLRENGVCYFPSHYGDPYPITRQFIEEGQQHRILGRPLAIHCPVRLLHGLSDADVSWQKSLALTECLLSNDVSLTLVKNGDHRLSKEADLKLLENTLRALF